MNSTSTVQLASDIPKLFFSAFEEGVKQGVRMLWDILLIFLSEHWFKVMLFVFVILIVATFKAMLGRWRTLGSVLYNLIYFGILFAIGFTLGPEIFVHDFFNTFCAVVLYPVCYFLVGLILKITGFKK